MDVEYTIYVTNLPIELNEVKFINLFNYKLLKCFMVLIKTILELVF